VRRQGEQRSRTAIASTYVLAGVAWLAVSLAFSQPAAGKRVALSFPVQSVSASRQPILGVVGASGNYLAQERTAGVRAVTIGVTWARAEPRKGRYSTNYLRDVKRQIGAARAHGLSVVLDPGLQYAPNWVFALPGGTRFVNQYGQKFTGSPGSGNNVANGITDPSVRSAEAAYMARLGAQFPRGQILAVRCGGGPLGELRYPDPEYRGHTNSYWAYDASTQADSPLRGWLPGTGTAAQATLFLDAYNSQIDSYGRWLDAHLQADFRTDVLVMLPGWGERPGAAAREIASLLTADLPEFNEGLDWKDLLRSLPNPSRSIAYTTYLDAPSVEPTLQLEDPMDYIATLAAGTPIRLGGENTGNGTPAAMDLVIFRALQLHLYIVQWMDESQLAASGAGHDARGPTFSDLRTSWRQTLAAAPTPIVTTPG
jgi:Glycosyl hydrolases family 35